MSKQSRLNIIFIIIIFILIGSIIGLYFYLNKKVDTQTQLKIETIEAKNKLQNKFTDLQTQFSSLSTNNTALQQKIAKDSAYIASLITEIENYKGDKSKLIAKYEEKLQSMRDIMKSYIHEIDSLNTLNKQLTNENTQIKEDYNKVEQQYQETQEKNTELESKVDIASTLKAMKITGMGINYRFSKEREVKKAKNTEKIKICCTIDENPITPKGTKDVYFRIAQPDGAILIKDTSNAYTFVFEEQTLSYSIKERIDYQGTKTDVCTYWAVKNELKSGLYTIDIFMDNKHIGTKTFTLK